MQNANTRVPKFETLTEKPYPYNDYIFSRPYKDCETQVNYSL